MSDSGKQWYKQKEIAEMLKVQLNAVRQVVAVLERIDRIQTQPDFEDRRYTLVHASAIPIIRQALGLPDGNQCALAHQVYGRLFGNLAAMNVKRLVTLPPMIMSFVLNHSSVQSDRSMTSQS